MKIIQFGKQIPGLKINGEYAPYPVLNEREIRAGAGVMFAIGSYAFYTVLYTQNFMLLDFIIPLFYGTLPYWLISN